MEKELKKIVNNGFFKHNNYKILEINEKSVIIKVELSEISMNPYNIAHGGLIFGLGDNAMGILASINNQSVVTVNATINYLKKATGKYLIAKAEMLKEGNTLCYLRANIYNDKNTLVATMDGNYCYIK